MLTESVRSRYAMQIRLPEIGLNGQELLGKARVLVVGAGGLGCPVLQYLTGAGVGHIGIVDLDSIAESNLHRQVIYGPKDVGAAKCTTAANYLALQNPFVTFSTFCLKIDSDNVLEMLNGYDIVVDCTDSFAAKYTLNDACLLLKIPLVYASIAQFEAQISIFALGATPYSLHQLFPFQTSLASIPDCDTAGVIGALAGLVGCLQALEVIKIITGMKSELVGKVLVIDALSLSFQTFLFAGTPTTNVPTVIADYEALLSGKPGYSKVTASQLRSMLDQGIEVQLVDVREEWETQVCSLGGLNLPLPNFSKLLKNINPKLKTVFYCHHGVRSLSALEMARANFHTDAINFFFLQGGIDQWAISIAPEMKRY